ncbi:MAG: DUF3572 family protein [Methyloligellaceae bacterium]
MPTNPAPTLESAEILALQGLAWLAADPTRLEGFMTMTGITREELHAGAATSQLQAAILGHFLQDETLLLTFTAGTGTAPTDVAPAYHALVKAG